MEVPCDLKNLNYLHMNRIYLISTLLLSAIMLPAQENVLPQAIVADGATLVKAATGFSFTEGPSCAADGRIYFTDQPNDKIHIWDEQKGVSLFTANSGRANGTYFDRSGNLLACADLNNKLVRFSSDGKMTDLVSDGYNGKHLNGPNDLWSDPKGGIYFTDPYFARDYWEEGHTEVQDCRAVYYLKPEGGLVRVIDDFKQPNGIVGTPDGKQLYVADQGSRTIWKYDINADGSLSGKTLFAQNGSDGMTIDEKGNVYITSGRVIVFDPNGVKIGEIPVPEFPTNLCFGGKDRKTLFITARTSVYTLSMKVRGVE